MTGRMLTDGTRADVRRVKYSWSSWGRWDLAVGRRDDGPVCGTGGCREAIHQYFAGVDGRSDSRPAWALGAGFSGIAG